MKPWSLPTSITVTPRSFIALASSDARLGETAASALPFRSTASATILVASEPFTGDFTMVSKGDQYVLRMKDADTLEFTITSEGNDYGGNITWRLMRSSAHLGEHLMEFFRC